VRRGRSLELTPRATLLLPSLERGLSDLQSVVTAEPAFDPKTARRLFRLGTADYSQALLMRPLLRHLEHAAPQVDLSVVTFLNLEEQIEAGGLDLGIVVTGAATAGSPVGGSLSTAELFSDQFVCVVRRGHPVVKDKLSMERYLSLRHVLVAPGGSAGSIIDTELERRGFERRVALRLSNFLTALSVVAETDLISTTPRLLARHMAKRFSLHLLPPPLRLPRFGMSLAWHPRFEADPAHRWLRTLVTRVCAQMVAAASEKQR
jgi:DNA-binding transcriptional LysR family regulator